jgi:AcrR family transcriptional regulator
MARTGRRPGNEDTRGSVLNAARSEFAVKGFHGATIRSIASVAGVDPALVHHYFGTKEDLFAESIHLPMGPSDVADLVLGDGIDHAGANIARLFFTIWENPDTRDPLLAMLRGALTTEQGADVLREFFGTAMLGRIAPRLQGPDPELRVSLVASQLVGTALLRYVIGFPHLEKANVDELVAMIAPRIQTYLTP